MFITVYNGKSVEINNTYFKLEDGKYEVVFKKFDKASKEQFGYWFGGIVPAAFIILKDLGWNVKTEADAHEFLLSHFFTEAIINERTGETVRHPLRMSKASKKRLNQLYEDVWLWASELGYTIQRPNDRNSSL